MTVDEFRVAVADVRPLVPPRYRLSRYGPTPFTALTAWVLDCPRVQVGRSDRGRAILSLVGVVVSDPRARGARKPVAPNRWQQYLLAAHSDNRALARDLRRAGLPARFATGIARRAGRVSVPGVYAISTPILTGDDDPHDHANSWWFDGTDRRPARMELTVPRADDRYCDQGACSRITAPVGSTLRTVLGPRARVARSSFSHPPLDAGLRFTRPAVPDDR